jgi:biopolymer transport protein ExbD
MRARRHRHDEDLEFQIAPMIDVLLVILVFFVTITSASVLRLNLNLHLPIADHASKMVKTWHEVLINATWDDATSQGTVAMTDPQSGTEARFSDMNALTAQLKPLVTGDRFRVVLRADRDMPASFVQKVVGACAAAGIGDVTFSAVNVEK